MSRRKAKNMIGDSYGSRRDYQKLQLTSVGKINFVGDGITSPKLVYTAPQTDTLKPYFGFGGYIKPDCACDLILRVHSAGRVVAETQIPLGEHWNRIGIPCMAEPTHAFEIELEFPVNLSNFQYWGFDFGNVSLPTLRQQPIAIEDVWEKIQTKSLFPMVYYLPQDSPCSLDLTSSVGVVSMGVVDEGLHLKKCPSCTRMLPVDPNRGGALAFDNHAAKLTKHQNECRACKKLKINDDKNKIRTTDQLHESSVITREKKFFLREPTILEDIKDRNSGEGLKSIVWKKFNKRCFRCNKPVTLKGYQLDHTRPLAFLWSLDIHATCLCSACNNEKHDKFPSEFYTHEQLERLSSISGLSMDQLQTRDVNEVELDRFINDIGTFSEELDPRTFNSIAARVLSVRPDTNLYGILEEKHPEKYIKLRTELAKRPE